MGLKDRLVGIATTAKYCNLQFGPQIAFGIGVVSLGLFGFTAVKAGFKFREVLEEHNALMEEMKEKKALIDQKIEAGELPADTYTEQDYKTDRRAAYIQFGMKAIRTWVIPVVFGLTSVGSFAKAALMLNDRYLGAVASLAAVTKEKQCLEDGITNEYGADALAKLKGITEADKIISGHVDNETGETVVDSVDIDTEKLLDKDAYSEMFKPGNPHFEKSDEANRFFIQSMEDWANFCLQHAKPIKGVRHYFLNQARGLFEFDNTQSGQIMGWKYYDDPAEAAKHPGSGEIHFSPERIWDGKRYVYKIRYNVEPEPILTTCGLKK